MLINQLRSRQICNRKNYKEAKFLSSPMGSDFASQNKEDLRENNTPIISGRVSL